jgi:cytidine deaminase
VAQARRRRKSSAGPAGALDTELVLAAQAVRAHSYSPYSKYAVGAALRGTSGKIYSGVNVENAAYPLTICAERAAIFSAVSQGERSFTAIAVVTANGGTPCGACRQVLAEFHVPTVIVADTHRLDPPRVPGGGDSSRGHGTAEGERPSARRHMLVYSLAELLPHSFDARKLPR